MLTFLLGDLQLLPPKAASLIWVLTPSPSGALRDLPNYLLLLSPASSASASTRSSQVTCQNAVRSPTEQRRVCARDKHQQRKGASAPPTKCTHCSQDPSLLLSHWPLLSTHNLHRPKGCPHPPPPAQKLLFASISDSNFLNSMNTFSWLGGGSSLFLFFKLGLSLFKI